MIRPTLAMAIAGSSFICSATMFAQAAEFCTSPSAAANDRACTGALSEGFGGVIVYEHEAEPDAHLGAYAQWLGADFSAEGDRVVIAESSTGPMWRPRAVLLDSDTAFVVWGDGRRRPDSVSYLGIDLKGAVLRRGESAPSAVYTIIDAGVEFGSMDPAVVVDPLTDLVIVSTWLYGGRGTAETPPTLLAFPREKLLAAPETLPDPILTHSENIFSEVTMDHARRVLRLYMEQSQIRVGAIWAPEGVGSRTMAAPLPKEWTYNEENGWPWYGHKHMAVGPNDEVAVVWTMQRGGKPAAYLATLFAADGTVRHTAVYTGPIVEDINLPRPKVAFSGNDPVLFLPVREGEGIALLVAPLSEGEISAAPDKLYPLPGHLEQFDIIIADHGTSAKAALIASSGGAPAKVCVWPSELIGY